MEWISVEDRLPEEKPYRFECVLAVKVNNTISEVLFNTKTSEFMTRDFGYLNHAVTHWMPLPEPPKESV